MQLDDEIVKKKIMENIDETSSILDVLKLGSYYYGFMAKEIILGIDLGTTNSCVAAKSLSISVAVVETTSYYAPK